MADALRKQGQQAKQEGDLQGAFLYLARSATYILEKIPHHPAYHELNPTQMSNLKNNGQDILHNLEQLKPRLADRYEQWLAKDPRNAQVPSELQNVYGQSIAPIVLSRATRRNDSFRDGQPQTRAAVSQQHFIPPDRQGPSVEDLTRDINGMRINNSPDDRRLQRSESFRRAQEEAAARRQWQEQADLERRRREEANARIAQEEAMRRQWDFDEMERRRIDEERRKAEYDRSQQIRSAALDAAWQAAHGGPSPDRYSAQNNKYRESSISAASQPTPRATSYYEGLPHHPLQDPALRREDYNSNTSTPIWEANHTPTLTRTQRGHNTPLTIDPTFAPSVHIQYPQLMSAHQRAQGYQPSVMLPSQSPVSVRSAGSSSGLYNINLPQHSQQSPHLQNPPSRTSSMVQPKYSPAPPPPNSYTAQATRSPDEYVSYDIPNNAPPPQMPQRKPSIPAMPNTHRRQNSVPEVPPHPLGLRPIDMPAELLDRFLGVARLNTLRKIETCGLLLGRQRGNGFSINTLLIPEQRGTQDTCIMESEELVVEFVTGREMLTVGWIHTHPTQSCFMSSLDLHTHAAYQSTLKEAIAIVCAPSSDPRFGIFRLTDPPGLDTIMSCRAKETFHPHPDMAIYTDCDGSHVRLVSGMHLEIVDLRRGQDFSSSSEGTRNV